MKPGSPVRRAAIRLPSTDGLRAFEVAARLGSFERAAQEINLTSSAVSKRVGSLEEVVGTALFIRKPNSLVLTEAGTEYLEAVREVLRLLVALPAHTRFDGTSRRLRITSTPTFARQVLAPNLSTFSANHPGIELELIVVPPIFDYPATDADVEIRNGDAQANGVIPLMQDLVTPMASPALLTTLPSIQTASDLQRASLIRTPLEPWLPWFNAALLDWPEPSRGPKFHDLGLTFEAAVNGHGIALCRPSLVRDWLARKALLPLLNIFARPANQYYAMVNTDRQQSQVFVRWLQRLCSKHADVGLDLARAALAKCAKEPPHDRKLPG